MHDDARGARRVERARRPVPRRGDVAGGHRHERLIPSKGQRYLILRLATTSNTFGHVYTLYFCAK